MMKILIMTFALFLFASIAIAGGGLESFLKDLNVQARVDMEGFSARVSSQFGVPTVQVKAVIGSVREPADAFMCFQLGQWTRQPAEQIVNTYKSNQSKGWGVLAKQIGIKPGSAEFHALKRGDLTFDGRPTSDHRDSNVNSKGKGKGHNK